MSDNERTRELAETIFVKALDISHLVRTAQHGDPRSFRLQIHSAACIARISIDVAKAFETMWRSDDPVKSLQWFEPMKGDDQGNQE